jgi:hypothetical protein
VSAAPAREGELMARAQAAGVAARVIGPTGGSRVRIGVEGEPGVDVDLAEAERVWSTTIGRHFETEPA